MSKELLLAAQTGNIKLFDELVASGADPKFKDEFGSAILYAIYFGQLMMVVHLLAKYPESIKGKDLEGNTALLIAAAHGHIATLDDLLKKYPESIQEINNDGMNALLL